MSSDDDAPGGETEPDLGEAASTLAVTRYSTLLSDFVSAIELAAATVFAFLFAIGVVDLTLQIFDAMRSGRITDPLVVIGFIDTGLLLLIIVEVYQTVLAYVEENETRRIVRLVIYTGVIAMVRKVIIFRTGEYASVQDALWAAVAYTSIIVALVALLVAERIFDDRSMPSSGRTSADR
ncbi:MAG: phosphate-starvation-inducible PsiE family protein [Halanaeroarchaeum sp.]